jgi:plastocyanin
MTKRSASKPRLIFYNCVLLASILLPVSALADNWQLQVGAQRGDITHQALAFLPNEIWIHSGDSITWTFAVNEIHTVTFLTSGQVRPSRLAGCPGGAAPDGRTPDFSVYDTTTCVNSGIVSNNSSLPAPPTYTVLFPAGGNFKLVCLAHPNMTATIHVLALGTPLPHDQGFYDKQAERQSDELLSDDMESEHRRHRTNDVIAGVGHIVGNTGGTQTVSVMRFMEATKVVHVGETVEWTSAEAVTSHTITFGPEPAPANQIPPSANVSVDADGARHAFIGSTSDIVHSGFITQPPQDRIGLAQAPLSVTRFRVTFTQAGVYPYICVLHDELGMVGQVIVLPNGP